MLPALLFASGAAALVYQVLWIKQLSLVVGVDVYAVTTGISAFFAGLAAGGLLLGRLADRTARPLLLYAAIEAGVAILAIVTTLALAHAAVPFARLEAVSAPLAWMLCLACVAAAPFLMGGTLPVMVRALDSAEIGAAGGRLYAANTAGAIAGALLAPFVLIPAFGVQGAAFAAAVTNLAVAAIALYLNGSTARTAPAAQKTAHAAAGARAAMTIYAIAGGIALGYEVVWSQTTVQFMSTRSFAFAVMLATYLTGLAIGSALLARRVERLRDPWGVFGLLIAAAGLVAILEVALLGPWIAAMQSAFEQMVLTLTGNELSGICARFAVAAACVVLVPTILLGAALPLALRLSASKGHAGRDVGAVVALNTMGGIAGTLLTGFVLVPLFGLVRTLGVLAISGAALGLFAALRRQSGRHGMRWAIATVAAASAIAAFATPPERLGSLLTASRGGTLLAYEESRGGTIAAIEQSFGANRFRRLYIQGVSNSGDAMPSLRYMRLQALLPLLIHNGTPRSALVIGFGTGITAGALLRYGDLERRVVAELLPAVVRAGSSFRGNYGAASSSALDIRLRDGRRELIASDEQYDLITLEPPPPSAAGVVNLYSSDFYKLAAARLRNDGIVAQWLPIATQNDDDTRSLVRSFLDVFPNASLWTTEFHEMLLVGSPAAVELDVPRIASRFERPDVSAALREVGVGSVAALLATYVTDRTGLERYAGSAPPVTDDRPRIEYATWVGRRELARTLPALLALRMDPPLKGADDLLKSSIVEERTRLLRFCSAGLHAYNGERAEWAADIERVLVEDGRNPYFRWFTGSR